MIAAAASILPCLTRLPCRTARAATAARATGLRTPVREPLEALVRTMQKLHADRHLQFVLAADTTEPLAFRGEEQDFYELMGNLIDNAGKWASSRVDISARAIDADMLELTVDDDGPGLNADQRRRRHRTGLTTRWTTRAVEAACQRAVFKLSDSVSTDGLNHSRHPTRSSVHIALPDASWNMK